MSHTKGKWEAGKFTRGLDEVFYHIACKRILIASMERRENTEANAKRIVHCVNNFDEMLRALEAAQTAIYDALHAGNLSRAYHDCVMDKIEQAIKHAEDKEC